MHVWCPSMLLKINQMWGDMQNGLIRDVNTLPQETVNQNLLAHFWINGSDRPGSDRPTKSPQSGNPNVLSFYLWVGKSKQEKCIAACSRWARETQNTPRKLFCLIKIKENGRKKCVYESSNPGCLFLPLLLVGGRVCACAYVCAQKAALSWSDRGDL